MVKLSRDLSKNEKVLVKVQMRMLRPYKSQNFLNFLFSLVSEMFSFQKFRNFLEIYGFFQTCKNFEKKVWKLKFGNNFEY